MRTYRTRSRLDRSSRRGTATEGVSNAKLAATLYPIEGLTGLDFAFRILRVREPIPSDNMRTQRLQKWADKLWREQLKTAVVPTMRYGWPAFLVLENVSPAVGTVL